jgi:hypothetical protein
MSRKLPANHQWRSRPVKFALPVLLLSALLLTAPAARAAEENRYDILSKMLLPFLNIVVKSTSNPNRAMQLTATLEQMTNVPPALIGAKAELAMQYPDKVRLRGPMFGEDVTVCRRGQEVWAYPASKLRPLLEAAAKARKLPKLDKKARLEPFSLPIPEKQLVFLPALFQIKDIGTEPLGGDPCRVLDIFLTPELSKSLKSSGWAARVWARPDSRPARLSVAKPGWNVVVRFQQVDFSPALPESTWEPASEQASDILTLDAPHYQQLLEALVR